MIYDSDYFTKRKILGLSYGVMSGLNSWHFKRLRDLLRDYVTFHKSLLDVGCAYGHFLSVLRPFFSVYGTDISSHAISVARSRFPDVPLKVGDITKGVPFGRKFDIITALDVIEHLSNPRPALKRIHGALNSDGLFFFEIPCVSNGFSGLVYRLLYSSDKTHVFVKSFDEVKGLVESAGFVFLDAFSTGTPFFFRNRLIVKSLSNTLFVFRKA